MAAVQVRSRRPRRDVSLGHIPLSSGEIELYTRQDEMARRRRRLLAVRDQERRLAQQVTQRYRTNLQKLQDKKNRQCFKKLNTEQQKVLSDLHVRYENSMQSMGTAHRNARLLLVQLMDQAQEEKKKWAYNCQVAGKQRISEAKEAQEEAKAAQTAKRQFVEQNMEKLKLLSGQQRQRARARTQQEQEIARQQAKDREERETLRKLQSPEEVFVTPKPRQNDIVSYRFTRNHCLSTLPSGTERSEVTVIRHNRKHPTALRGEDEAMKYKDEMDQKREQKRVIMVEQQEIATERGRKAIDEVTQRQKGEQTLEWLALVDKMERRARGQELGEANDCLVDTKENNLEQRAERAFAEMFGLDEEDSAHWSTFSIDTEDNESVDLAASSHSRDEIVGTESTCQAQLQATKRSRTLNSPHEPRFQELTKSKKSEHCTYPPEELIKSTQWVEDSPSNNATKVKDEGNKSFPPIAEDNRYYHERVGDKSKLQATERCSSRDLFEEAVSQRLVKGGKSELAINNTHEEALNSTTFGELQRKESKTLKEENEKRERAFSSDDEDNSSADSADTYHKRDKVARPQSKYEEHPVVFNGSLDSPDETAREPSTRGKSDYVGYTLRKPLKSSTFGDLQPGEEIKTKIVEGKRERAFSVSTEDNQSVELSDSYHDQLDGDEFADTESGCKTEPKAAKLSGSVELLDETESTRLMTKEKSEQYTYQPGKPSKSTIFKEWQHSESKALEEVDNNRERAFSTDNEANRSVELAESYQNSDKIAPAVSGYKVASKHSDSLESFDDIGSWEPSGSGKSEHVSYTPADESFKSTCSFRHLQREEGNKRTQAEKRSDEVALIDNVKRERGSESGDTRNTSKTRVRGGNSEENDGVPIEKISHLLSHGQIQNSDRDDTSAEIIKEDENLHLERVERSSCSSVLSVQEKETNVRQGPLSGAGRVLSAGRDDIVSVSSESHEDESNDSFDEENDRNVVIDDEEQSSVSVSSFAPSQKSLSRLNEVMNVKAQSLGQRFVEQHMRSFSEYSGDDGEVETESHFSSVVSKKSDSSAGTRGRQDVYRQQIHRQAWRHSTSDMSVAQFSLPPSDTQSSFDESLDRLHEGSHGDDSFVNELVPLFAKRVPSVSDEEEQEAVLDDYDIQLVSPQMRRMLPPKRHAFFGRTRHCLDYERHEGGKQAESTSGNHKFGTRLSESSLPETGTPSEQGARSDISNESGTSSLGFTVQLNLAAGTTRRCGTQESLVDDEVDKQSSDSSQSFGARSMDAHLNYHVHMASVVEKSLPLHLRVPGRIYGDKDMTKPPVRMVWSTSSGGTASEKNEKDRLEEISPTGNETMNHQVHSSNNSQQSSHASHRSKESDTSSVSSLTEEARAVKTMGWKVKGQVPPCPLSPWTHNMSKPPVPMQNISCTFDDSVSQCSDKNQSADVSRSSGDDQNQPASCSRGSGGRSADASHSSSESAFQGRSWKTQGALRHSIYGAEEERKQDDSSSESGASSRYDASCDRSDASSRRQRITQAEHVMIKSHESDEDESEQQVSLADAFRRRHPGFGKRRREKQKRQEKQQEQQQDETDKWEQKTRGKACPTQESATVYSRPRENQTLLDRLAGGHRATISEREMKARNRRLYQQLPEVIERKRQEEVTRRRRQRLDELREQEKERRYQAKQRRT